MSAEYEKTPAIPIKKKKKDVNDPEWQKDLEMIWDVMCHERDLVPRINKPENND